MIKAVIFDMYETLITHYNTPLYFGKQMAEDMGISEEKFQKLWRPSESDRSIGKVSFEDIIERILRENLIYSNELLYKIVHKRLEVKKNLFLHMDKEIIPMLNKLKETEIKIGLISNCFSEETTAIRNSILYPYFDSALLSYDEEVQKPNKEIYKRCMNRLSVLPEECIYIGDGGSFELETAKELGMIPLQACWYMKEGTSQPTSRKAEFLQLESPMEVLNYVHGQELS